MTEPKAIQPLRAAINRLNTHALLPDVAQAIKVLEDSIAVMQTQHKIYADAFFQGVHECNDKAMKSCRDEYFESCPK